MSHRGDPVSAEHPLPGPAASDWLSADDAERLIAWHWADPEAGAGQHALAALFDSAAAPATDQELSGEAAAVAAFLLAASGRAPRPRRRVGRRTWVAAAGIVAASAVGLSGAAAADALPGPVQEMAHNAFGAPAPSPSGSGANSVPASRRPPHVPGAGKPTIKATDPASGKGNGATHRKGTPPGLQKSGGTPPGLQHSGGTPPGPQKSGGAPPGSRHSGSAPSGPQKGNVSSSPGTRRAKPWLGALTKLTNTYEPRHSYPSNGRSGSSAQNWGRAAR